MLSQSTHAHKVNFCKFTNETRNGIEDANNYAFGQDVAIWENKIYIPDPVVCDGDGPLRKLRKWYGQFLVNRADIPSGLDLKKREF